MATSYCDVHESSHHIVTTINTHVTLQCSTKFTSHYNNHQWLWLTVIDHGLLYLIVVDPMSSYGLVEL